MVTSVPSGTTIFIVDTEQDAGRFACDMCAYITGHVNSFMGEEYATLYEEETEREPMDEVIEVADDKGMMHPCSVWPTPGWFNNGAGGNYKEGEESLAIANYRRKVLQERSSLITQKQALYEQLKHAGPVAASHLGINLNKLEREIGKHQIEAKEASETNCIPRYPAYLSVAIFFRPPPSELTIDIMKVRAFQFVDARKLLDTTNTDTINITGFRLLRVQNIKNFTKLE